MFLGNAISLSQNMKVDTLFLLVSQDSSSGNTEKIDTIIMQYDSSCGNPIYESQLFTWLQGRVVKVLEGNEIEVILNDGLQVVVHLNGIEAPSIEKPFGLKAKQYLENVVLNKEVGIIIGSDWRPKSKPLISRVSGIVEILNKREDINCKMLSLGLAKYAAPTPYSMSDYLRCTYERTSRNAERQAIGVWSVAP